MYDMHLALPEPGKTTVFDASETIDLENISLDGGFLVKVLVLSIDPYMRGRMRDASKKSYNVSLCTPNPYPHSMLTSLLAQNPFIIGQP